MYCRSPKGMSAGAFKMRRTTLPDMLEMLVNVRNMHGHVLAYFVGARRPKLGPLAAQHDGALGNVEFGTGNAAT